MAEGSETITMSHKVSAGGDQNQGAVSVESEMTGDKYCLMIMADKHASGGRFEKNGNDFVAVQMPYQYEKAWMLVKALRGEDLGIDTSRLGEAVAESITNPFGTRLPSDDPEDEMTGVGLEALSSLTDEAKDALKKTNVVFSSDVDDQGRRSARTRVDYDGNTLFDGSIADLFDETLGGAIDATALEADPATASEESAGAEVVATNGTPNRLGLVGRFRATADGENDRIDNENTNVLTQIKAGFIVVSALDANINAGVNATLAIFVA